MTIEEKLEHVYRTGNFVLMEYLQWDNKLKKLKIGNGFTQKFAVFWHIFIGKSGNFFFKIRLKTSLQLAAFYCRLYVHKDLD